MAVRRRSVKPQTPSAATRQLGRNRLAPASDPAAGALDTFETGRPAAGIDRYLPVSSTQRGRAGDMPSSADALGVISRMHARFIEWQPVWQELAHIYEGTGPYTTGDALIPHVRELLYKERIGKDGAKSIDFTTVIGYKIKYKQRQALARYENFAATIVDTLVDHQYAKEIVRKAEPSEGQALLARAPIADFWADVDGYGTSMDDFLKIYQTLANVFGHIFVLMDRLQTNPQRRTFNISAGGQRTSLTTLADQGQPVLRVYTPLDAPDWLAPFGNRLAAIKFVEPIERKSLFDLVLPNQQQYIMWDAEQWQRYNQRGRLVASGFHQIGELPIAILYARRRSHIPIIGRSDLRDPVLYRDHYNLISELRELLRSQTFSMLHIQLSDDQTIDQARALLGDHAGTDSLIFSKNGADFIAPPDGPAARYTEELANLERKIFRLVGLPWASDLRGIESADSLLIKGADLDRSLASHSDFAQFADYQLARLWFNTVYGADRGPLVYAATQLTIQHPNEFNIEALLTKVTEVQSVIDLGVGPTATKLLKGRVIPLALLDLEPAQQAQIQQEIDDLTDQETAQTQAMQQLSLAGAQAAVIGGVVAGGGTGGATSGGGMGINKPEQRSVNRAALAAFNPGGVNNEGF